MDAFEKVTISVDVNSASMPQYRVEIEMDGHTFQGTGYSIDEATRKALASLRAD